MSARHGRAPQPPHHFRCPALSPASCRNRRLPARRRAVAASRVGPGGALQRVAAQAPLSSDAKCNTPRRFGIGRLFKTLRSVAMRSYSHLSEDERDRIGVLRAAGRSIGAIARALCRAKTTISRELQRNALPSGGYSPLHAAGAYQLRRRREAILEREVALRLFCG